MKKKSEKRKNKKSKKLLSKIILLQFIYSILESSIVLNSDMDRTNSISKIISIIITFLIFVIDKREEK